MMPGANSSVNSTIIRMARPKMIGRLSAYAIAVVVTRLSSVPTTVIPMLTIVARVTIPPARIERYAPRLGSSGQSMIRPPLRVISSCVARLVATTVMNG